MSPYLRIEALSQPLKHKTPEKLHAKHVASFTYNHEAKRRGQLLNSMYHVQGNCQGWSAERGEDGPFTCEWMLMKMTRCPALGGEAIRNMEEAGN